MSMVGFWLIIGIIFLIIEIVTIGLVSIWFSIGAFITSFFTKFSLQNQFGIFVLTSLIVLIIFRKMTLKKLKGKGEELDRITNKEVVIKGKKDKGSCEVYNVYLDGKYWEALSDMELNIGDKVKVEKIKGNKLILKKYREGNL